MLGQVIRRDEKDQNITVGDPHEVWLRYSGRQMGYIGNNGSVDVDYASSIPLKQVGGSTGSFADFDLAYDHINAYTQGSSGGVYTIQSGDTLQAIAANLWGDASLWYKIAEVNGINAETPLVEGQMLIIPVGVQSNANNATTFQPYDPLEVLGNLNPTAPKQFSKKLGFWGAFAIIMAMCVGAIVSYATYGVFSNFFAGLFSSMFGATTGTAAGTAVGGAVGGAAIGSTGVAAGVGSVAGGMASAAAASAASQAVLVAGGVQEKFSWNAVAMAAIGAGVGGVLGAATGGPNMSALAEPAVRGALGSVITQGIGVATGLQDKFSWAGVAAAGIGAWAAEQTVSEKTLTNLGKDFDFNSDEYMSQLFRRNGAAAIMNAATRSLIEGSDFGDNMMQALPQVIGQSVGDEIAGAISYSRNSAAVSRRSALNKQAALCQTASDDGRVHVPISEGYVADDDGRVHVTISQGYVDEPALLDRIGGGLQFALGVGVGFLWDTVKGIVSLTDYVVRDMGGSALYWINEGIDAVVPGDLPNPYRQSWVDYTNASQTAWNLGARIIDDPGGFANDVGAAFSAAVVDSNNHASPFERGFTNPWGKVITGVATLPFVASRVGAVTGLNRLGQGGRASVVAAEVGGARGLRAADAIGDAATLTAADDALAALGVTDRALRQRMLDAGFDPSVMNRASNTTRERFHDLFQGTLDKGRSFRGVWGTFETRIATITRARELERAGYIVDFDVQYPGPRPGVYKWADLVAESDTDSLIVQFETNPTSRTALANQRYFERTTNSRVEIVPVVR